MTDLSFVGGTLGQLAAGVPLTLSLTALSVAIGGVLAVLLAVLGAAGGPAAWLVRSYVFVFRGSPLLVQLYLIYYGLGQFPAVRHSILWPFLRQPYWCTVIALALNTAAYGSEIVRGGLLAVPAGAVEAARACGMSGVLLYRRIVLPLAVRQALPAYSNEIIIMVKSTSLASIVTLMEITGIAYTIISETFRPFEVFACAGAIYLLINFAIARAVRLIEHWLTPHLRAVRA